jgi:hypothetical protein
MWCDKIDWDAWNTTNPDLRKEYQDKSTIKVLSSARGEERKKLKSPLCCALTGIPIFPGDYVHAAEVIFRDGPYGISDVPIAARRCCILFHAEIQEYLSIDLTRATERMDDDNNDDDDDDDDLGFIVDEADEEDIESSLHRKSYAIITTLLNSLMIITDSYFGSNLEIDYCKNTPYWYISQACAVLEGTSASYEREEYMHVDKEMLTIMHILKSKKKLNHFIHKTLMRKDYLLRFSKIYLQHKFAIYTLRHILAMVE